MDNDPSDMRSNLSLKTYFSQLMIGIIVIIALMFLCKCTMNLFSESKRTMPQPTDQHQVPLDLDKLPGYAVSSD